MSLETGSFVNDFTVTNPAASDAVGSGDDHLRLIKTCVQGTFPQMGAIFGQVRSQDTALSISAIWNTNHFVSNNSATTTVVLTLPPAASITAGWFCNITTLFGASVSLLPSGAASINGTASFSIPSENTCLAFYAGSSKWYTSSHPNGQVGNIFGAPVRMDSTLTVSGVAVLNGAVTMNGACTISGAVTLKNTLSISGVANFGGAVSVSGAANFAGTVTISGQATMLSAVTFKDSMSISGAVAIGGIINALAGQIAFPASQNASAGANTLDDYEKGTWTPVVTFSTPGNLAVVYSTQTGAYCKVGRQVTISMQIVTTTFTHTTASGQLTITGLPFTSVLSGQAICGMYGGVLSGGSGLFVIHFVVSGTTMLAFESGAGAAITTITTGAVLSGTQQNGSMMGTYLV